MKVRLTTWRYGFTVGKVYKIEGKTRKTYLLRNNSGYLESVKASICEVARFWDWLIK